ncbi:hypothetical protein ACFFRR_000150 [Megaselia abdita]
MAKFPISKSSESNPFGADLRLGLCFPRSCSPSTVNEILQEIIRSDETLVAKCTSNERIPFSAIDWVAIGVFTVFAIIVILSSIYDYRLRKSERSGVELFKAFSLFINFKVLCKMSGNKRSPNVIYCLNGIRSLSIIWIVFGHCYMVVLLLPTNVNSTDILDWLKTPFSMFLQSGTISVDSFFFLSGFLLSWVAFKELEKTNGKLNIPLMYLHRYLRLAPVVAICMLFYVSMYRHLGNGPLWDDYTKAYHLCDKSWWGTLLFVQNYAFPGEMCFGHTWYLAVDTQLYLISPIILIGLYKWKKIAAWAITTVGLMGTACVFTIVVYNGFVAGQSAQTLGGDSTMMRKVYYSTHTRAAPWIIGIFLGWFMFQKRGQRIRMGWMAVAGGWTLCLALLAICIFALYPSNLDGAHKLTSVESAFYIAFSRIAWPLGLSWLVFACTYGYGGFVNTFLSWSIWEPFSRLSYCVYLIHLIVETAHGGVTRSSTYFSDFEMVNRFWGDFGITLLISIVVYLVFEAPMAGVEKALFGKSNSNQTTSAIPSTTQSKEHLCD